MTEREIEIRERIRKDRTEYKDSVLTLKESHIVMNAMWRLQALENDNALIKIENDKLRERLNNKLEVEFPCKIGTKVYAVYPFMDAPKFFEYVFVGVREIFTADGKSCVCAIVQGGTTDNGEMGEWYLILSEFNHSWWDDKEIAEKHYAKLKTAYEAYNKMQEGDGNDLS